MLLNCGVGEDAWCPLDCKEIQLVHPKGDQSWVFIGRTDVEAEIPILWPPDGKSWLIGKDPDAGKDWGQEEKGMTEDDMIGWHHQLSGHGFGWTQKWHKLRLRWRIFYYIQSACVNYVAIMFGWKFFQIIKRRFTYWHFWTVIGMRKMEMSDHVHIM